MYKRFLNDADYLSILTEEALEQLIRGRSSRLAQAEEAAEQSILEYLTENYEIERELDKGKLLIEHNPKITYPAGVYFKIDGKTFKTIRPINGVKSPAIRQYWEEDNFYHKDFDEIPIYSQGGSYKPGDKVRFGHKNIFRCLEFNGLLYDDIRIPGNEPWAEVEDIQDWEPNVEYEMWDVVRYKGHYFTLIDCPKADDDEFGLPFDEGEEGDGNQEGYVGDGEFNDSIAPLSDDNETAGEDMVGETGEEGKENNDEEPKEPEEPAEPMDPKDPENPDEEEINHEWDDEDFDTKGWAQSPYVGDHWGMIDDYHEECKEYKVDPTEFVVFEDRVFYPIMNPIADDVVIGYNVVEDDPRNPNLKKHMLRLAIYELYKLITPTNMSQTRIVDYETSITWLRDAGRLKISPGIPRRLGKDHKPICEYAVATFMKHYNPYENAWHI